MIYDNHLELYAQRNSSDLILKCLWTQVEVIHLKETTERDHKRRKVSWNLIGGIFANPIHAPSFYQLSIKLANGERKYSYISDFDLIRLTKLVKKINSQNPS